MNQPLFANWVEQDAPRSALWRSEGYPLPKRIQPADDRISADQAYKLACEGTAILWRGDFQNARQLLQAMARRIDRRHGRGSTAAPASMRDAFNKHRQTQAQRARVLGMLLLPFEADCSIPLRRAPDVRQAAVETWGTQNQPFIAPMRELLGIIGAHEWRKKGVAIPALGARIHPHYGVFSPVRGEYIDLVSKAPLPSRTLAFDIGTGTGVLAALLARRGVQRVIATDMEERALRCARENINRLELGGTIDVVQADLFPPGRAPLIICNPPWLPARPSSIIEQAVYDPDSRMLRGFLDGLTAHLEPGGEGWLILSDIAEHLELRSPEALQAMFTQAGLKVIDRLDAKPMHRKATDPSDPLHAARSKEITSLWRLASA